MERFNPIPTRDEMGEVEKMGSQSIFRSNLRDLFGRAGNILFETLAISYEVGAKIIAFGDKTADLVRKIGSKVVKIKSAIKEAIKRKRHIITALGFMGFAVTTERMSGFISQFQITDIGLTPPELVGLALTGLLLIANG